MHCSCCARLLHKQLAGIERVNENIIPRSLYSEGLVTTILGLILKNLPLVDNTNKNAKIISSIIQYVNDHYAEKLTLDDVAKHFGYSKYYFSKLFNKNFICHFSDYVNHVRCRAIITILNSIPNQTILTTIMNSGFSSPSAFYKFFKDHYNISPSKIKKLEFSDEIINFDLSSLLKN